MLHKLVAVVLRKFEIQHYFLKIQGLSQEPLYQY